MKNKMKEELLNILITGILSAFFYGLFYWIITSGNNKPEGFLIAFLLGIIFRTIIYIAEELKNE